MNYNLLLVFVECNMCNMTYAPYLCVYIYTHILNSWSCKNADFFNNWKSFAVVVFCDLAVAVTGSAFDNCWLEGVTFHACSNPHPLPLKNFQKMDAARFCGMIYADQICATGDSDDVIVHRLYRPVLAVTLCAYLHWSPSAPNYSLVRWVQTGNYWSELEDSYRHFITVKFSIKLCFTPSFLSWRSGRKSKRHK